MRSLLLACAGAFSAPAFAGALPDLRIPDGVGVNIHFTTGHRADLDQIRDAGFKVARMDFSWAGTERNRGEYQWDDYDELTSELEDHGIRPYYILDYSNPIYERTVVARNPVSGQEHRDTASPQTPESIGAFAAWAAASAIHFKGRHVIWEIWNEPNITFWKPKPDVSQYTALALATCRAIRNAVPDACIVGPATSGMPEDFLDAFLGSEVLQYLDAVSVHPYRSYGHAPETAGDDYRRVRDLIQRHAPAGRPTLPILSGEWGYSSFTRGVSLEVQAAFVARMQVADLVYGVPVSIWYDWIDDGPDPAEREHRFGTVTQGHQPKPAYIAIRTLTRELGGFRLVERLQNMPESDWVVLFRNDAGERRLALWTTAAPHAATLQLEGPVADSLAGTTSTGDRFHARKEPRGIAVDLDDAPRYLHL